MFAVIVFFLLGASPLYAWNGSDHQAMTRLALEEVASEWGLHQTVEVHPLTSFVDKLSKIRPDLGETTNFSNYLRINPKIDLSHEDPKVAGQSTLTPLEVLSLYSTDPDDGRDQNLPPISPDQKWFGSHSGPDSQAFRHIEKAPFDIQHPLNTFGFPFRSIGEATQRAEIYYQLSLLAFSLEEDYWGWRFLAGCLHYLEDLHQPYHAGQITPGLLTRGLWAYVTWGHKKLGFMGTFSHLVSNSHRFFESYVALSKESLPNTRGHEVVSWQGTIRDLALHVRDVSNTQFASLICAVTRATDPRLLSPYDFKSDEEGQDDPNQFLKTGAKADEARQKIFEIVKERFESAGRVIRTAVKTMLENQRTSKSEEILQTLDVLLTPLL